MTRLRLSYESPGGSIADVEVTVDGEAPIQELADAFARRDGAASDNPGGWTLVQTTAEGTTTTLTAQSSVAESGLRPGSRVVLAPIPTIGSAADRPAAVLTVHSGPDAGSTFPLPAGISTVGRGSHCAVRLRDPMVSLLHARVVVGADGVELVDENSSNGLLIGGELVPRLAVRPEDRVIIGESQVSIIRQDAAIGSAPVAGTEEFNRSPRVAPRYEGRTLVAPEPPQPPSPTRFPFITALVPILMGFILLAATGSWLSVIFIALSPLMLVGGFWENRRSARLALAEQTELFRSNLATLVADLTSESDLERQVREQEHPGTDDLARAVQERNELLWTRRPEHGEFMELRLGLGTQVSRIEVEHTGARNSLPELRAELDEVIERFRTVDRVPIVGSFDRSGSLGVGGPGDAPQAVARSLVLQTVSLHSPSELALVGIASSRSAARWEWVKWLPHVGSAHSPVAADPLASTPPGAANLVAELLELIAERESASGPDRAVPLPRVLVLVDNDGATDRSSLVQVAERGPACGIHVLWVAGRVPDLPAACRSYVEVSAADNTVSTGRVVEGELSHPVLVEPLALEQAERLARLLAPVVDSGAVADDAAGLPAQVSFVSEAGADVVVAAEGIIDRWRESGSLPSEATASSRRRPASLRALVGRTLSDPFHLDLRVHGPHALVGGTTGAGKSEFLQTWVLGMAAAHSPQRVTFLFVDYKGGSAFADCVDLPHSVGLVTDLSPRLVQRALISLNAELRYREHVLNKKKAKDLLELERRGDPECPPALIIIVDEFAALVQEVPEFVDGVVNVAQRGRSLGLHLVLATQRPAGVIKDNLRANTNLRVALRMADEEDSNDVIGTTAAAAFDPAIPGRAIAKTGPGRLTAFQAAYSGGWTSDRPTRPEVDVHLWHFGAPVPWDDPTPDDGVVADGPADIGRVVTAVSEASRSLELPVPRRPWLPELASVYDLSELPSRRTDSELVLGVIDQPDQQSQRTVAFHPDRDGNLAVFGTGGSGRTTTLRTLAVSAGLTARGGPCVVYGLDFGARGLTMLEDLPHVGSVIAGDDVERVSRLIRQVRDTIDDRAVRYARVNAATIDEYRRISGEADEARVLVVVDGFSAFRSAFEAGPLISVFDQFLSIAADGRPVGVHIAVSADRYGAIPASLQSSIQRRLALRLADDTEESILGVPRGGFEDSPPPGRGYLDGQEIQVAVLGGTPDVSEQAAALQRLAESMRRAGAVEAPPIERLPERVLLQDLPSLVDGLPVLGLGDELLAPVPFEPVGSFLVAGPVGSGRSRTVATMVQSLRRAVPSTKFVWFGQRRSPLAALPWDRSAIGVEAAAALAEQLTAEWSAADPSGWVLVLDGLGEFLNSDADYPLQDLLKVCRSADVFVIAEGETADVQGSWPLLQAVKSSRCGIVLQPDQVDGDSLFRTVFPRLSRADFPPGRGMYVKGGKAQRVQAALVE